MDLRSILKNFLIGANSLVSILGIVAFSIGIWVVTDKPQFLDVLNSASDACTGDDCADMTEGLKLYTTGAGIIIAMSFLTVCVAVLGCCGAHKQSRVMLTSFSVILLLQFIIMLAGAIVANNGGASQAIQDDMIKTLGYYNDDATQASDPEAFEFKNVWNKFQAEFHCCGVINVTDWSTGQPNNKQYNFPAGENKPQGCCTLKRDGTEIAKDSADETACRKAAATPEDTTYYFGGCFTGMMERVNSHKSSMITIGVLTLVFMFVNIVSSFGLCMMLTGDV